MSHMKEVAKILGVDIGEKFKVDAEGVILSKSFFFTDYGLFVVGDVDFKTGVLNQLLNGEYRVVKIPRSILTEKEKEYLSAVVKPFRDEVKHISKNHYDDEEWVQIRTKQGLALLPPFKEGLMYNGMKVGKEYSVKELDI